MVIYLCNTNIVFDNEMNVNVEEIKTIVNDLACNKSSGLDSVSAEQMQFAGPKLCRPYTYVHDDIVYLYSRLVLSLVLIGVNISERKSGIERTKNRKKRELVFPPPIARGCNW